MSPNQEAAIRMAGRDSGVTASELAAASGLCRVSSNNLLARLTRDRKLLRKVGVEAGRKAVRYFSESKAFSDFEFEGHRDPARAEADRLRAERKGIEEEVDDLLPICRHIVSASGTKAQITAPNSIFQLAEMA